ncbi:MAG TPA: 2-dehydropantoate 2-reductase [Pseudonocardiaceae bacterium]|jgi:2-dehydropantoate 2-reductase|nr:2-dehydropantoate 2-reductase [Pseudonocardiaceae bacterium]
MTRILVVGAGATGAFFGSGLAAAGNDVTFLVRPRRRDVLRERGLRIIGSDKQLAVLHPKLLTADELTGGYDAILLSVKADALDAAMADFAPAVGEHTAIIPFLNGMAHLDALNDRFGQRAVLGGVVRVAALVDENGDIRQLAPWTSMIIGEQNGQDSDRQRTLADAFAPAAFDFATSDHIIGDMWHKWVFISAVTAITTLLRGSVGEVAAVPGGVDFATGVLTEAATVSAAAGYPLSDKEFDATRSQVTQPGSPFVPSMYRDLSIGLPTEVEHVFGDLLVRADKLGVGTPLLDLATMNLRVHQNRAQGPTG